MAASLVPNTLIGARYRLERRIGQGGMAEVWLANDISLNRKVAVKMMKAQHNNDPIVSDGLSCVFWSSTSRSVRPSTYSMTTA